MRGFWKRDCCSDAGFAQFLYQSAVGNTVIAIGHKGKIHSMENDISGENFICCWNKFEIYN